MRKIVIAVLIALLLAGAGLVVPQQAAQAALSAERDTASRAGQVFELGVATGVTIYKGALVAVNSSGYATPGATATTLVGLGRAEATVTNSGLDGAVNIRISRGIFRYANSTAPDAIANSDIGKLCYIVDDATVALTDGSSTRSPAGRIFGIDSSGVWVEFLHFSAPGTVVSADIVDGTIATADIADNAVTTAKLAHTLQLGSAVTDGLTIVSAIQGATPFILDGTTDDAFTLSVGVLDDPTASKTVKIPSKTDATLMISSLVTNDIDVANSVWGVSNGLAFGGSTGGDGFETKLTVVDPTADRTATLPDATGTIAFVAGAGSYKSLTIATDNVALTTAECGKVYGMGTAAKTFTLPATTAGCVFTFINTGAATNNIVEIIPGAGDKIMGQTRIANGDVLTILGDDAEHVSNTAATSKRGDYMTLIGDGVDGWYIVGSAGIWAEATP